MRATAGLLQRSLNADELLSLSTRAQPYGAAWMWPSPTIRSAKAKKWVEAMLPVTVSYELNQRPISSLKISPISHVPRWASRSEP